jgi:hypothetical protein
MMAAISINNSQHWRTAMTTKNKKASHAIGKNKGGKPAATGSRKKDRLTAAAADPVAEPPVPEAPVAEPATTEPVPPEAGHAADAADTAADTPAQTEAPVTDATPAPAEPTTTDPAATDTLAPADPVGTPNAEVPTAAGPVVDLAIPDPTAGQTGPRKRRKAKDPAAAPDGKMSALDAAVRVLAEAGQPMNCQQLIGAMAIKGYWSSPAGKTPAATLYASILKEISTRGEAARFVKVSRGLFGLRATAS